MKMTLAALALSVILPATLTYAQDKVIVSQGADTKQPEESEEQKVSQEGDTRYIGETEKAASNAVQMESGKATESLTGHDIGIPQTK